MIRPGNLYDFFGALLFTLFGVVVSAEAYRLQSYASSPYVGDHTLPSVLGGVFLVLGVVLLFRSLRSQGGASAKSSIPAELRIRLILCLSVLFLYIWLLGMVGYIVATWLISVALFRLIGWYRWTTSMLYAAILTISQYLIFVYWLQIAFS